MGRDHFTFGAGCVLGLSSGLMASSNYNMSSGISSRRICPGIHVAERELWLGISRLLWAYSFHALPNEPISLQEYEGRSGRTPMPFRLRLLPRHENLGVMLDAQEEITLLEY